MGCIAVRVGVQLSGSVTASPCRTMYGMLERGRPELGVATVALPNDELQRTRLGFAWSLAAELSVMRTSG